MENTVVIYGPQQCGKSTNSDALMRHFGCTSVFVELCKSPRVQASALIEKIMDEHQPRQESPEYFAKTKLFLNQPDDRRFWAVDIGAADPDECTA